MREPISVCLDYKQVSKRDIRFLAKPLEKFCHFAVSFVGQKLELVGQCDIAKRLTPSDRACPMGTHCQQKPDFRAECQGAEPCPLGDVDLINRTRRPEAATVGQAAAALAAAIPKRDGHFLRIAVRDRWKPDCRDFMGISAGERIG